MDNYLQVNQSNQPGSGLAHLGPPTAGPQIPIRQQQYAFNITSSPPQMVPQQPRFGDGNPRPSKSPRHVAPSQLPPDTAYPDYGTRFAAQYAASNEQLEPRGPGHFPPAINMQPWTGAPDTSGIYAPPMPALASILQEQHYEYPSDGFSKTDSGAAPSNYSWSAS